LYGDTEVAQRKLFGENKVKSNSKPDTEEAGEHRKTRGNSSRLLTNVIISSADECRFIRVLKRKIRC
jgi:hypothetical protein